MGALAIDEARILADLTGDHEEYARTCLKIRTKAGAVIPLVLNEPQLFGHRLLEQQRQKTGRVRAWWLKGRQQGASTYITSRHFRRVVTSFGVRAAILTHEQQATDNLFAMVSRYYEHLPPELRPRAANASAKELYFNLPNGRGLDSGYLVATAGTKGAGRSSTAQLFHGSEVAHWPNATDHLAGIAQAVPGEDGTEIIYESTANGVGNVFHQGWQAAVNGEGDFIPVFTPWFWSAEYRRPVPADFAMAQDEAEYADAFGLDAEQIFWRRLKINDDFQGDAAMFDQEYPATPEHAFLSSKEDTLIKPVWVAAARKSTITPDPQAPKLWGLDVAEYGDDRSALARRQGRVIYRIQAWAKRGPMELVGIVANEYDREPDPKPQAIMVDVTGVGTGPADRLLELGLPIIRVHFGERAVEEALYRNRRDEMWIEQSQWFQDKPCRVPDEDSFQSDLTGPTYKSDSSRRKIVESKEHMKKRGVKSPDLGDASALTFAYKFGTGTRNTRIRRNHSPTDWRVM